MLVALTQRKLKPGTYEDFKAAFMPDSDEAPPGWKRFYAIRGMEDPNEVITFGFYDGTVEDLRSQDRTDYDRRISEIGQYVESVGPDGFYELLEERTLD